MPAPPPGIIPYLIIEGASEAIALYMRAFGAIEKLRLPAPGGRIGHAEIAIEGHPVYLADYTPDMATGPLQAPSVCGASSVILHRYVPDVDAAVVKAVNAGLILERPPEDQFYGDRTATLRDPYGHLWALHTRLRDVSPEEMLEAMSPTKHAA